MLKYKIKTFVKTAGLAALLFTEACFRNVRNPSCRTWEYDKRKVETCVMYNNSGEPIETKYTIFNGWNLPIVITYDKGLDGPDRSLFYSYNQSHKVKRI